MLEELLLFNMRFKALVREILEEPSLDKFWDLLYEVESFAEEMSHEELKNLTEEYRIKADRREILLSTYTVSSLVSEIIKEDIRRHISPL